MTNGEMPRRRIRHEADERLLAALAEHIKLPLLQIARRSELAQLTGRPRKHLQAIELTADTALTLLDNYLLSLRLAHMPNLELEPVSVAGVLNDAAQALTKVAKEYDTELEIQLSGRYEPVMAHRGGLEAALTSLGYVFIETMAANANPKNTRPKLLLAAHRGKTGIVAGLYAGLDNLSSDMYKRAHHLYGHARLAMPELAIDSGAGVFVADSLLDTMYARLRVARHHTLSGLAATLLSSRQLQLI